MSNFTHSYIDLKSIPKDVLEKAISDMSKPYKRKSLIERFKSGHLTDFLLSVVMILIGIRLTFSEYAAFGLGAIGFGLSSAKSCFDKY